MSDKAESARVSFQIGDRAVFTIRYGMPGSLADQHSGQSCEALRHIGLGTYGFGDRTEIRFDDGFTMQANADELAPLAASPETP